MNLQGQFWTPRPLHRAWGHNEVIAVESPGAAAEWSWTVPGGRLAMVRSVFTTVTVGEALKEVTYGVEYLRSGIVPVAFGASSQATKAGELKKYLLQTGYYPPQVGGPKFTLGWLPEMLLRPGDTLASRAGALEGGDTLTEISLVVDLFEEDPQHDLAEIEAMARRIQDLERKVAAHALPVHP